MSVKRYQPVAQCVEPSYQAQMVEPKVMEFSEGEYVLHSDYAALLAATQWRPIETAPKDGTAVLIYCQVSGAMEAHMEGGEWLDRHNDCREIYVVTHWMPLPKPPTA